MNTEAQGDGRRSAAPGEPPLPRQPPARPCVPALWRAVIVTSLAGTIAAGVWMRWAMTGATTLAVPFDHLRHAHSHLGYFGLLFPLAWVGWRAAGAEVPGRLALTAYALCTAVACVGFVRSGYGVVAIVGCTLVSAFWLWSAGRLLPRMPRLQDPLGAVPLGVVASLACVPPIALYLRSNPALAHGFVATFLSGLLLAVIVPSTLAGRKVSAGPWPFLLAAGCLGALHLGVSPHPITRVGLLAYAGLMLAPALARQLSSHARATWALVGIGLAAMAAGLVPTTRPVGLGAIHFLILGPVMATLAPQWMRRPPPDWAWWCGHATWGLMSAALVAQGFVPAPWTWTAAAIGGTGAAMWWAVVLLAQLLPGRRKPAGAR